METIAFPYVAEGAARTLSVQMLGRAVMLKPIFDAMGARWETHRVAIGKQFTTVGIPTKAGNWTGEALGLDIDDLDAYLRKLHTVRMKNPDLGRHFQDHLVATLRQHSVGVLAVEAQHQAEVEAAKGDMIEIHQELTPVDHFRRDASVGRHRLAPELINLTVHVGKLDLFVRPKPPVFAERPVDLIKVELDVNDDTYSRDLIKHMAGGVAEFLTGPEMQIKYPTHKALKRSTLPATPFYQGDRLVMLPERPAPHRWELAGKPKGH